jgi:hypothetical protein
MYGIKSNKTEWPDHSVFIYDRFLLSIHHIKTGVVSMIMPSKKVRLTCVNKVPMANDGMTALEASILSNSLNRPSRMANPNQAITKPVKCRVTPGQRDVNFVAEL